MSGSREMSQTNQTREPKVKYFSFQIKGWTNFDPMDKTLATIAGEIDQGNGFLTLLEVLTVENDVASIEDEEIRTCFENLLAAKRLISNFSELPAKVRQELRAALKTEEEIASKEMVALVPGSSVSEETATGAKSWL